MSENKKIYNREEKGFEDKNARLLTGFMVSPSKIGMLLECPRCLWMYYREGLDRPAGIFPSLPGGMDGVFKTYFDEYRGKGKLPPEIEGKVEGKLFEDTAQLNAWRSRVNGLKAEFPELNMTLKGMIDDLLVAPDGKYVPFDFKTRGYPIKEDTHRHYQNQIDLYALLFEKNGLQPADYGYLLFFYPETYSENKAQFKTELVKMDVNPKGGYEVLKKAYQIIMGPMPNPDLGCEYCRYRNSQS